eukprot:scaffold4026_cov117-Cylindrotheca_fusiformis.AAC.1
MYLELDSSLSSQRGRRRRVDAVDSPDGQAKYVRGRRPGQERRSSGTVQGAVSEDRSVVLDIP